MHLVAVQATVPSIALPHDNLREHLYARAMAGGEPHIVLTLDTKEPIELGAFVGAFTSLGNEYERYMRQNHPDLTGQAEMYVREVREGSIVADMLPWFVFAVPFIDGMDKIMIVEQFVRVWGGRFRALLGGHGPLVGSRSELKDWADAVRAIAADSDATGKIEAATFEDGKRQIRAAFKFDTKEARDALRAVESRQKELEKADHADYTRVLMVFTRSDIGIVAVGKPSGERVRIEEISDRPLALAYGSELAEQRIKHEIIEADENVYKKGFIVDVNVKSSGGKPVAYSVTHVHQVLDLD